MCRHVVLAVGLAVGGAGGAGTPARAQDLNDPLSGGTIPAGSLQAPERVIEWMFFPATPPVLGAEVAVAAASRQSRTPAILRAFLTEPFYPQLAARIVHIEGEARREQVFDTEELARIDSFMGIRAALLKEIHDRAQQSRQFEPRERRAAFEELASRQRHRLDALESSAEWLRIHLGQGDSWNEYRTWRLKRGSLDQARDRTYVLEFWVVRASAYYQEGFSRAQRRLVRELAIEMNETIAAGGERTVGSEAIMFFSPDTARIMRPRTGSPDLESKIVAYIGEKRRLKDELREIIYEADGLLLEYTRRRRIAQLAGAQADAIERLERRADEIREEVAALPEYRRYRGAPRLNAELERRLEAFAEEEDRIEADRAAFIRERLKQARSAAKTPAPGTGAHESVAQARAVFEIQQGSRLIEHERVAEALLKEMLEKLPAEEAGRLNGSAEVALRDYIERRAEQDAYVDYDLAVLEPGLSPAQRRLMLGSAMGRLRQVMLMPERQPTTAPATLLGIGR